METMTLEIVCDGERCESTLADFIDTNDSLDADIVATVCSLAVGSSIFLGGGAAVHVEIRRVA